MKRNVILVLLLSILVSGAILYGGQKKLLEPKAQAIAQLQADVESVDTLLAGAPMVQFENSAALKSFEEWPKDNVKEGSIQAEYISPEGIQFISLSAVWNEEKLEDLYQELLLNKHGEEIYSLSSVMVLPQADDYAAATHQQMEQNTIFSLHFPAVPRRFGISLSRNAGLITLYNGNEYDTVEEMAGSLSHEYGHHFTFYHMFKDMEDDELMDSEYVELRAFKPGYALTNRTDTNFYYNNHHRYVVEIAAEDYVALMGSPTTRRIAKYFDVQDSLEDAEGDYFWGLNAQVQENLMIPMASSQPGLAEYFYSFVEDEMPDFDEQELVLRIDDGRTEGFNFESGYTQFEQYTITWDKVYGEDAIYTLVCFELGDYMESFRVVRTIYPGMEAEARVGDAWVERGEYIEYAWDDLNEGKKYFVVTVVKPDGTMYISEQLIYDFGG